MRAARSRGIASMLTAVGLFAGMDAILKILSQRYPALQVSTLRGATSLPFILLPALLTGRLRELRPVNWRLHLVRGVLAIAMLSAFVYAVRVLSLADAYAVFLTAPLLVTALSVPLLREHVDRQRWLAIGVGLIGAVVILRPSASGLVTVGALAALLSAICYSLAAISVRVLTRTDSTTSMVFWFMFMLTVFGACLAAAHWTPVRLDDWPWLLGLGLLGALGQHFITEAFRQAPASVVAPFEYTALIWALAIDWFVWTHLPQRGMLLGAAIIVGSGLYLLHRERSAAPVACDHP